MMLMFIKQKKVETCFAEIGPAQTSAVSASPRHTHTQIVAESLCVACDTCTTDPQLQAHSCD